MNIEAINLYLKDNGITVSGTTDTYYRLNKESTFKAWYVDGVAQPTDDDLKSFTTTALATEAAAKILKNRRGEYPSTGDQLDMIYKDIDAWKVVIKAVKDKYPKE
jgi:hypothetical protein